MDSFNVNIDYKYIIAFGSKTGSKSDINESIVASSYKTYINMGQTVMEIKQIQIEEKYGR